MRKIALALGIATILVVLGCVRIPSKFEAHITVDIRQQIQQEAASTLDVIEGKSPAPAPAAPPVKPDKTSWLNRAWDLVNPMPVACAESNDAGAEKAKIVASLRERSGDIQALKAKGIIGESNRGYVELRGSDQIKDPNARNEAQRLIAAENHDRKALYQEDARANKEKNVSVSVVEHSYAAERLKRAAAGEVVQLPPKGADFDAFKASPAGQRLGGECVPDAWVTLK